MPTFWRPISSTVQPSAAAQAKAHQLSAAQPPHDTVPLLPAITTRIAAAPQKQAAAAAPQLPATPHASAQQALRSHEEMQQLMHQFQQQLQQQQQHLMMYGEVLKDQGDEEALQAGEPEAMQAQALSRPPGLQDHIALRQEPQGSGTLPLRVQGSAPLVADNEGSGSDEIPEIDSGVSSSTSDSGD
ncbi:hypothetical protein WJX73_003449 [Symbiochloris irregularis]|uniref:Uncharacterized protein n=1 Tax=Symbiochloris irregularis TaxID=706552 RepID=A0AAW1PRK9_9CHLO